MISLVLNQNVGPWENPRPYFGQLKQAFAKACN